MHNIKLIVFDIAGTTIKDGGEIGAAFWNALKEYGYIVPMERISLLMGYKKPEAIRTIVEEQEEHKERISEDYINAIHECFLELMLGYYRSADEIVPLPGTLEVFSFLKKNNIKIGLDTGFSKDITEVILQRLGWLKDNTIDYAVSSDEVPAGRPHPYMIQRMMQQANISNAQQVIKVGDTEVDVQEGKNAGCLYSIAVTTGAFTRAQLEPYKPSFILDNLEELLQVVTN